MSERTLAAAAVLLARSLKLRYDGTAIASRIPRMMMTTKSSMRVKPLSSRASRILILSAIPKAPSTGFGWGWLAVYRRTPLPWVSPVWGIAPVRNGGAVSRAPVLGALSSSLYGVAVQTFAAVVPWRIEPAGLSFHANQLPTSAYTQ